MDVALISASSEIVLSENRLLLLSELLAGDADTDVGVNDG